MKVFISWSGSRSKLLAEALREFLPLVIQKAQPFMSAADIGAGTRWPDRLNRELDATDTAIICLTPENRQSRWIHYEAGALAKKLEFSKICLCLLNLDKGQVEWPLAQFQLKYADEHEIRSIVSSVNSAMKDELDGIRLQQTFNAFWPMLRDKIEAIPKDPQGEVPPERDEKAQMNEMLQILRGMASKRELSSTKYMSRAETRASELINLVNHLSDNLPSSDEELRAFERLQGEVESLATSILQTHPKRAYRLGKTLESLKSERTIEAIQGAKHRLVNELQNIIVDEIRKQVESES